MMNSGILSGTPLGAIHDLINDVCWSGPELGAELRRRALALLPHRREEGENFFVIAHANSPSFFADLFAVWEAGGCAVCVNAGLTEGELRNVIEFLKPCAVLVDALPEGEWEVPVLCLADSKVSNDGAAVEINSSLDDPALVLFTSGTSGNPKGVVHTHRSILSRLALNRAHLGQEVLAKSLCVLPTHFGHGLIGNCLTPLLAGGDIFLLPGSGIANVAKLGPLIDVHGITFMSSVPAFWKVALRVSQPPTGDSLRRVSIGSAPLSSDLWNEVRDWSKAEEVVNMYGITETANWIGGASSKDFEPEDGLLGKLWGGQIAVKNEAGEILSEGEGEILLRVPSGMASYYQRPDLTEEVLKNGWFYTGDTGTLDSEGVLRMTGRNRYAINQNGMKIYPEEIDLLFERHEGVIEACAFGLEDALSGQVVAAAVKLTDESGLTDVELLDWARERIRPEAVPKRLFILSEIPKTDRGKLNRDNVAAKCLE